MKQAEEASPYHLLANPSQHSDKTACSFSAAYDSGTLERNRADRIYRAGLVKLFDNIKDPILVIKWKEVYQHLEDATDTCEDVADILEGIVLKHA